MNRVATIATNHAFQDLRIFLKSLMLWQTAPTVYLYADKQVATSVKEIGYTGKIVVKEALNKYSNKTRQEMERTPGSFPGKSLWFEFQMEKLSLLEWVFACEPVSNGTFYLDSDICFLAPLPTIPPNFSVAVSPHMIRPRDEILYGKYNAGFVWVRTLDAVKAWHKACDTSRFFEQAALEVFDSDEWAPTRYVFPIQENYGWWRMFQGEEHYSVIQRKWSIFRRAINSGITVDSMPLGSIHTHWITRDATTTAFNTFVLGILKKLAPMHQPAKKMLAIINDH